MLKPNHCHMSQPRSISISKGDMALILGRYKSLHFVRLPEGESLQPGEVVHFTHHLGGGLYYSIPVIITHSTRETSNSPLSRIEEWQAGRISAKPKPAPSTIVSEKRMRRIMPNMAARIAKQILSRFETPLPAEVFAADIAGDKSTHPISRFSFALMLTPDQAHPLPDLYRRFKTAHDKLVPDICHAHAYSFSNHGHNGELLDVPEKSMQWAMRHLANHHTPLSLESILRRLRAPYEHLSQLNQAINSSRPLSVPAPEADGLNRLLAGLHPIPCSLDTGSLAVMGQLKRIAVRTPLPQSHHSNTLTAVLHATGQGNSPSAFRRDFQVPIEISTSPEHTQLFSSADVTPTHAREHGFATIADMRHAIGLSHGETCDIISYPFQLARAESLPLDSDREGKRLVKLANDARNAISTNNGDTSARRRAERYLNTLQPETRALAWASITPPDQHTEEMAAVAELPAMNKKGTRQLPNDVRKDPNRKRKKSAQPAAEPSTTLHGFEGLATALAQKYPAPSPQPSPPTTTLSPRKAPVVTAANGTALSPVITTPEEPALELLAPTHIHREGITPDGTTKPIAPITTARAALPEEARAEHIARAREAKKPRDKKPPRGQGEDRTRERRTERRADHQWVNRIRTGNIDASLGDEFPSPKRER